MSFQVLKMFSIGLLFLVITSTILIKQAIAQSITHSANDIQGLENKLNGNGTRLRCWYCSSDTIGSEDFCGTTFREDKIPIDKNRQQNFIVYHYCNNSKMMDHSRSVCRKTVEERDGKTVVKRYCYHKSIAEPHDYCKENTTSLLCFDCATDNCNSAPKMISTLLSQNFGIFATITISILLPKILVI